MSETINKALGFGVAGKFITPKVFVTNGKEKKEVGINQLQFGYVAMFATSGNPDSVTDLTKFQAGKLLVNVLKDLPQEAIFEIHMPASVDVRDSTDTKNWQKVIDVPVSIMYKASQALAKVNDLLLPAYEQAVKVAKDASLPEKLAAMPAYEGMSNGKGKRSGGSKVITLDNLFK